MWLPISCPNWCAIVTICGCSSTHLPSTKKVALALYFAKIGRSSTVQPEGPSSKVRATCEWSLPCERIRNYFPFAVFWQCTQNLASRPCTHIPATRFGLSPGIFLSQRDGSPGIRTLEPSRSTSTIGPGPRGAMHNASRNALTTTADLLRSCFTASRSTAAATSSGNLTAISFMYSNVSQCIRGLYTFVIWECATGEVTAVFPEPGRGFPRRAASWGPPKSNSLLLVIVCNALYWRGVGLRGADGRGGAEMIASACIGVAA